MCINRLWGTVCNRNFGISEAKVACQVLGFTSGNIIDCVRAEANVIIIYKLN